MANSFQVNDSAALAGLGTFSNTVTVTGNYTLEFKSFIPYLASGSQPQSTVPSPNVTDITLAADSSGSRNNTYVLFGDAGNAHLYYLWFNINAAGTDPAVSGRTGIEVAGATDATANTLATAARAAINASGAASYMTVSGATSHVILSQKSPGTLTAFANGAAGASAGATFSVTAAGSFGEPAISGLTAKVYNNSVLQATFAFPSPTQPILGGAVRLACTAGQDVSLVLASLSNADAVANAVKTVVNFYQGI